MKNIILKINPIEKIEVSYLERSFLRYECNTYINTDSNLCII